ncbi:helix-turn-helix domain-containing protein [Lapidilactobacillus concavus]|uniref:helix-turn-helix transcriptional regulator n=1 Tax=Lapidilactobacillus concavus TaxID=287844 RepID=UPI0009FB8F86
MNLLKKLRKQNDVDQVEMAKRISVSYSHYVKLENNFVNPCSYVNKWHIFF